MDQNSSLNFSVRFDSNPEIVEIPPRTVWQRRVRPMKQRCIKIFFVTAYALCYPCIEIALYCKKFWKSKNEPVYVERRESATSNTSLQENNNWPNPRYIYISAAILSNGAINGTKSTGTESKNNSMT